MSIWAKIAKYGGSALKGAGSVAKQGLKSASNTAVHPTQALRWCHGRHQQQVERHEQILPWHLWRQRAGDVRQLFQELRERKRTSCQTSIDEWQLIKDVAQFINEV